MPPRRASAAATENKVQTSAPVTQPVKGSSKLARDQGTASPATRAAKRCPPSRKLVLEHPTPLGSEQEEQPALWGDEEEGVGDINDHLKPEPSVAAENGAAAVVTDAAAEDTREGAAIVKQQPSELAGPEAEVGEALPDTNVEQQAKPKEEPQAEKDKAAAVKDDEEASTAPLPEKVSCTEAMCACTCTPLCFPYQNTRSVSARSCIVQQPQP